MRRAGTAALLPPGTGPAAPPPTLARASSALPSSTNASSMTGSSRNEVPKPRPGTSADSAPTENDVVLPTATRLFMLGLPCRSELKPSASRARPGPSSAKPPSSPLTCRGARRGAARRGVRQQQQRRKLLRLGWLVAAAGPPCPPGQRTGRGGSGAPPARPL
jgi:hypothetical protein